MIKKLKIASFITSHGYGHATRTIAILNEFARQVESLEISIFCTIPKKFFEKTLDSVNLKIYPVQTDVGLVQNSPFEHDLNKTITELESFLLFNTPEVSGIKKKLQNLKPDFILSDISPLGIFLADQLKIPSVLIENFTWDWIYDAYVSKEPRLIPLRQRLQEIFSYTDLRIQTRPLCKRKKTCPLINPIFRNALEPINSTRSKLGITSENPIVLITTGGITQNFDFTNKLARRDDFTFIVMGKEYERKKTGNVIFIHSDSSLYFPNIVNISSIIVGKAGYSTISEAWGHNKVFFPVFRTDFRESNCLKDFIHLEIPGLEISNEKFQSGDWIFDLNKGFINSIQLDHNLIKKNGKSQAVHLISSWCKSAK